MAENIGSGGGPRVPAANRTVKKNDNKAAVLEVQEAQTISVYAKMRAAHTEWEAAAAVAKAKKDAFNELITMGSAITGCTKTQIRDTFTETLVTGERKNQREDEAKRARLRRILGLPVADEGEQEKLDMMPIAVRSQYEWEGQGYADGLAGHSQTTPAGLAGEDHQAYLRGWNDGQAKRVNSMKKAEEPIAPPPPEAPPELTPAQQRAADRKAEKAAKEGLDNLGKDNVVALKAPTEAQGGEGL